MRTHILGLFASRGDEVDWERVLAPYNVEASLFVGDWEAVENALDVPGVDGPEAAFGRALCAMRSGDQALIENAFYAARESLGGPIVAAGRESYRRVYDSVVHLHILDDLQRIQQIQVAGSSDMPALAASLSARLHASAPTFRAREPILNHRRIAFSLAAIGDRNINAEVGSLWLETSKIARKAGHFQTAYSAILQARDCHADFAFFQSAKLFKANDQTYKAIQELDNAISPILATIDAANPRDPHIVRSGTSPLAKVSLRLPRNVKFFSPLTCHPAGRTLPRALDDRSRASGNQRGGFALHRSRTARAAVGECPVLPRTLLGQSGRRKGKETATSRQAKDSDHVRFHATNQRLGSELTASRSTAKWRLSACKRSSCTWLLSIAGPSSSSRPCRVLSPSGSSLASAPASSKASRPNRPSTPAADGNSRLPNEEMLTWDFCSRSSNDGESHELTRFFRRTNRYIKDAANAKPIPTYLVSLRYFTFGPP
jgi:hypothetical protein